METSSTARMPSKWRETLRATSIGATPARGTPSADWRRSTSSASLATWILRDCSLQPGGEQASAFGEDPARAEPEKAEDQAPDAHPLDCGDQSRRTEGGNVARRLFEGHRHKQSA